MAAKNTLEIIIKANASQAVAALNKLQSSVSKPFSAIKANTAQLGTAFESLTGVSLSTAGAFAVVGMAVSKLSDFIKSSVQETVTYGQTVRELSQIIGASADETSRMIQVADDYLISTEKLTTALRFAVKNGFEPSIDSLAKLADEFNAISDPNERAARMVQIFGRNWSALVPLLKAGGAAIRENAAAINDALIMTEEGQAAIFEYQQSMDNLDDSVQALKMSIGMALVPALNDTFGVINKLTPALNLLDDVVGQNVIAAYSLAAAYTLIKSIKLGEDISLENFARNTQELNRALEASQKSAGRTDEELKRMRQDMGTLGEETEDTTDALQDYTKVIQSLNLTTSQENALIESFGAQIGATGALVLTAANDMALLDAAVKAGAISIQQYTQYAAEAANGTLELDDQTRDFFDSLLDGQDRQAKFRKEMEAAATAVANTRLQLIGLAEQLRQAGPRERRNIVLDQLKELMSGETDPAKLRIIAEGITEFEKAVGLITDKDLQSGQALNDLVKALFSGEIDPALFDDAFNKVNEAIRTWKPGTTIDAFEILKNAGFIPTNSDRARIAEEYATIPELISNSLNGMVNGGMGGGTGGASGPGNPMFMAITQPVQDLADNISSISSSITPAAEGVGTLATNAGTLATNATNANVPLDNLSVEVTAVGDAAIAKNGAIEEFVGYIQDLVPAASAARVAVAGLAVAINSLQSKDVQITTTALDAYGDVKKLSDAIAGLGDKDITITVTINGEIPDFGPPAHGPRPRRRAAGGPVQQSGVYLVGESGPELFMPQQSGQIVPAQVTQAVIATIGELMATPGAMADRNKTPAERARQRREERQSMQNAINGLYKAPRAGVGLAEPAPSVSGYEGQTETADTQTERLGGNVTYNNYFPIQRVEDELDARALARLVAAEMARMPSR